MQNVRVPAQALNSLLKVAVAGGLGVYGVSNSIFNVEGGHRAIIFNRVVGIKDTVRLRRAVRRLARVDVRELSWRRFTLRART